MRLLNNTIAAVTVKITAAIRKTNIGKYKISMFDFLERLDASCSRIGINPESLAPARYITRSHAGDEWVLLKFSETVKEDVSTAEASKVATDKLAKLMQFAGVSVVHVVSKEYTSVPMVGNPEKSSDANVYLISLLSKGAEETRYEEVIISSGGTFSIMFENKPDEMFSVIKDAISTTQKDEYILGGFLVAKSNTTSEWF